MGVVVHHQYRVDKKEPLIALLRRVLDAFGDAKMNPAISASFADAPDGSKVSAVDRALRKHPDLAPFLRTDRELTGLPAARRIAGHAEERPFPLDALLALAEGVPRSLPFHSIQIQLGHPEFDGSVGEAETIPGGVVIGDHWWVNGRNRSLAALYTLPAAAGAEHLPDPPTGVATVLEHLGSPWKSDASLIPGSEDSTRPDIAAAAEIVSRYRTSIADVLERAALPHELPPFDAVLGAAPGSGPLKPALVAAFAERGFDCRGEPGRFVLRRRTSLGNVEILDVDVGTWSRMVMVQYVVRNVGADLRLRIPVGADAVGVLQYPIGDGVNWDRIVANVAAIIDELARTFLPEIEQVIGPSPAWFDPVS